MFFRSTRPIVTLLGFILVAALALPISTVQGDTPLLGLPYQQNPAASLGSTVGQKLAGFKTASGSASVDSDLVAYYSFDDGTATDASGYGNHGSIQGSPEQVPGVRGSAFRFGGWYDQDRIVVPTSDSLSFVDNFTFSLWFNILSNTSEDGWRRASEYGGQTFLAKSGDRTGWTMWSSRSAIDGTWYPSVQNAQFAPGAFNSIKTQEGLGVDLNQWHMLSATHGDGVVRLYLDGILQEEMLASEFNLNTGMSSRPLYIGQELTGSSGGELWYPFNGILDEIRIYHRVLGGNEILNLYQLDAPALSLAGRVKDSEGNPILGVAVTTNSGISATTNANGGYRVSGLEPGVYTLTPSKSGYGFSPPSRTVTVPQAATGLDFIGTSCIAPSGLNVCELQAGDILLKTGPTFGSCGSLYRAIFSLGGTYFTHSALYLGQVAAPGGSPDEIRPRIAEAQGPSANTADEVWETWLADTQFWDYDDNCVTDWVVVRPSTTSAAIQGAIAYARQKAAASDVVFDLTAFKNDPKKFYCSKLVWKSYLDGSPGGPNLEADRGLGSITFGTQFVTPDDLYYSSPVVQEKPISPGQKTRRGFFYIWSPGHLTLIDPLGRRTGYDPATGDALNEIPDAAYFAPPDVMAETITAPGIGSDWQLVVTGFDTGPYGLESGYADQRTRRDLLLGSTYPGKIETYPVADPIYAMFLPMVLRSP